MTLPLFLIMLEEEGGFIWQACSRAARSFRIFLSAGTIPERDSSGHIYNTAYVFDPDGNQIAKHRKMHLFDINVKRRTAFSGIRSAHGREQDHNIPD